MVSSRQVNVPFYRGIGRQRRWGFSALAQNIGRTAFQLLRKFIVSAAKRVRADLLEFAAPESAEVVSGRKKFKTAAKSMGDRLWGNSWLVVAGKRLQAQSFQQNLQNKSVGREETVLQKVLINLVVQVSEPTFFGKFWESWRESPSKWWCPIVPQTRNLSYHLFRWKLHRVWILNRCELLCWFETDVLGFETEICQRLRN